MSELEVGLVGVGNIGRHLARHLLSHGFKLSLFDEVAEKLAPFGGDRRATVCGSLSEVAERSDCVLLSLPDSSVVEEVVLGERGLQTKLAERKALVDTSSSSPSSTRRIAQNLAARGIKMLDAPVSGGVLRARQGTLSSIVGGDREVLDGYAEVLRSYSSDVFHVGPHGSGHLVKALNNLLSASTLASAAETVLLAAREGIDPEVFVRVVNASSGRSNSTEVKFPNFILDRTFDDGFELRLMEKDLRMVQELATESEFPLRIGSKVADSWREALAAGYGSRGHTSIYAFLEERLDRITAGSAAPNGRSKPEGTSAP